MAAQEQTAAVESQGLHEQRQYLTFLLGGEVFAIDILNIKEIIEYGSITEVPMMPDFIRGVINLRGSVVPVVSLSARFGKPCAPVTKRSCIVIVENKGDEEQQDMGVVVDTVNAVLEIPGADIEPPPAFGTSLRTDFIQGMGKVDGRFVIILDAHRVLSVDDMAAVGRVRSSSGAEASTAAVQPVLAEV